MGNGKFKAMVRSLLFSYILTGLLLIAVSFLLFKLHLKESQVTLAVNAIYILSCVAGGMAAGKSIRQRRFFWGLLLGVFYFLILFVLSVILKKGAIDSTSQVLTALAICGASGTFGGMIS